MSKHPLSFSPADSSSCWDKQMCLSLSSIPKESWAVWMLFKEKHLLAVGQGWEGLGLEKAPRQPGLHKSLFWQQVPGLVQVAGPTEESGLLLGLLVLSVQFGQDVGVSLTQAEQSKWKTSWEVKITSTVIYRPLCSYCLFCVRWEGKNCRMRPRKTGLIEPTHHKEIISTVPVCTALTKVWKRSVCYDHWEGRWAQQRPESGCLLPSCALLAAWTDFPLSTVLTEEVISAADIAEDKLPLSGEMKCECEKWIWG